VTVSIGDVAAAAGVAPSTVSRALRGRPGVSEEVRTQIARVAADLGYTASRSAASLASGRTCTVGVIAPYVGRWFFGEVLDSVEEVLSTAGFDVLLYNVGSTAARKRFFERMPLRKRVDGVLSLLLPTDAEALALRSLGVPLALVVGGPRPGFTTVGVDDRAGAELAVRHLVNLGHRRIAMIGTTAAAPLHWTTPGERRAGYLQVLHDARIAPDPRLDVDGRYTVKGGEHAMTALLAARQPPTAVFAQSDEMAMGALRALRLHRLRCPEDVSVVGFDNHELAEVVGLTTVSQSVAEQGAAAARLLLDRLEDPDPAADGYAQMPIGLVLRESTAPPRPLPG
jgi:LacI family transcriptional regulator, repressor for deo operon, udp, cdd, tsx, nupC, and nupG